jgi:hypothetical protein
MIGRWGILRGGRSALGLAAISSSCGLNGELLTSDHTCAGDHHAAPLFLRFLTDRGEKRTMEMIWGSRLKAGEYKYVGGFPHFVADGGDDRVGRWLDERIDLAGIYAQIWKDAAPAHVVDVALFCDSDDTHTASISYFAYVRLERR